MYGGSELTIASGAFTKNSAISTYANANGGAILNIPDKKIDTIYGVNFEMNHTNGSVYSQGGAIANSGIIDSISDAIFKNNYSETSGNDGVTNGGAILNYNTMTSINATFDGNYVNNNNSDFAQGGAIANIGKIDSIKGIFKNNHAQTSANNAYGTIYNDYAGSIGTINAKFENNYATASKFAEGGALTNFSGVDKIENSSFVGNHVDATDKYAFGGAIFQYYEESKYGDDIHINNLDADFTNNYVTANSEAGGGAIFNNSQITNIKGDFTGNYSQTNSGKSLGGAIADAGLGIIDSLEGVFSNNYTKSTNGQAYGGAIYNGIAIDKSPDGPDATGTIKAIRNATFTSNSAISEAAEGDGKGGAIYNGGTIPTINASSFQSNTATTSGGAIYNAGIATIKDSNFTSNSATGTDFENGGGAVYNRGTISNISGSTFTNNTADGSGGAIYSALQEINDEYVDSKISIADTKFDENSAVNPGGAIYAENTLEINNSKFTNNSATGDYCGQGGALAHVSDNNHKTKATISGTTFENNTAKAEGGAIWNSSGDLTVKENSIFNNNTAESDGGAIAVSNADITADKSTFTGNKSNSGNGGAIDVWTANTAAISNSTFTSNSAANQGGAIDLYAEGSESTISGSTFNSNSAAYGGAIYHAGDAVIKGSNFEGNNASSQGGAVYSASDVTISDNSTFKSNTANNGGAIFSENKITVLDATFENNKADGFMAAGGAISSQGDTDITNSKFTGNSATDSFGSGGDGGAVYSINEKELKISGSNFSENKSSKDGGAVFQYGSKAATISDTVFNNNTAGDNGGAINAENLNGSKLTFNNNTASNNGGALYSSAVLELSDSEFNGNKATTGNGGALYRDFTNSFKTDISNTKFNSNESGKDGGAIYSDVSNMALSYGDAVMNITGSEFKDNKASNGGAISANAASNNIDKSSLVVKSSSFEGNSSSANGGAVAANINTTLEDSNFTNNSANGKGGAVWANKDLTVNAQSKDVTMSGNKASEGGDIYMNTKDSILNMNAAEGRKINIASGISGNSEGYNIVVNSGSANTGSLELTSAIQNAAISVANGTLHLAEGSALNNSTLSMAGGTTLNTINNAVDNFGNNITLADNVNLAVDLDLSNNTADNFSASNVNGRVNITEINPIGNAKNSNGTSVDLAKAIGVDPSNLTISDSLLNTSRTVLTPVRYLRGSVNEAGIYTMAPTGNSYKDFNPSVLAAPIAAQLGGYFSQLNSYDEAFRNLDMKMLMTREERQAYKMANRYASAGQTPKVFSTIYLPEKDSAGWFRPFTSFENVRLKNGPKVSNVMYGSYFGGDSKMIELSHGWDYQYSIYIGYNGSHQAYSGQSIYQNGGNIGVTGIWYKDDFFTALTANVGASAAEANTMYGTDNFAMLMTGVASKTGYNWELAHGKFIIQPSFLMSYTFVNTFDYTNSAGVRMDSDPLHAINIAPGLKFIGNFKNGWQPYINVQMVWNIMDKTDFTAANSSLPDLSTDPYIQYGVGIQKRWGERFTGFLQAMIRNGGRNGVALAAGFRWAIGKEGSSSKTSYNSNSKKVIKSASASSKKVIKTSSANQKTKI